MIFNFKTLITAALLSVGGTAAMAGCVDNCSSSNNAQQMLQVNGSSIIGGNVGSVFDSNYGSNEVFKDGETKVDIMSELGGFCEGDDCTGSKLNINLMAMEHGSAKTTAGTKQSGADMSASNSGQFTSGTLAGINFGGLSTEVKTSGAAAFANAGGANATGKNVQTDIVSHGSGGTKSLLKTQGDACPTCVDFTGGTSSWAKSGMTIQSIASGGKSGQVVGIANMGESQSATHSGSLFQQNTSD